MSTQTIEQTASKTYSTLLSPTPKLGDVREPVAITDLLLASRRTVPSWKRGLDIACVVLAFPVLLPAMLLIALLVKLTDGGPVIFKQKRVGHLGQRFVFYKFRTMTVSCAPEVHSKYVEQLIGSGQPMTKLDAHGDGRLLPLGRLLRATGLDELPQIFNILRGDMSLVGPRPCLPFEYERYLTWQRERFNALPGLTGLWQVSGKNRTTFHEMVALDIRYCRQISPWLDFKIILKTVPAMVLQTLETHTEAQPAGMAPNDGARNKDVSQRMVA